MATSQAAHLLGLVKVALSAAITSQVLKCGRLGHAQVAVAGASLQGNNAAVRFAWQSAGQGRVTEWQGDYHWSEQLNAECCGRFSCAASSMQCPSVPHQWRRLTAHSSDRRL